MPPRSLDSALHAPQAGFGEVEFYPDFADKAAVLTVRIAKNHPLPDGNKRLAWQSLTMYCILNGYSLEVATDDAVDLMLAAAAGELTETEVAAWLAERLQPLNSA
ncbi:MAG TPA: type II toxin-antitoxin system death-on-curing family toxin [Acidimicrobiia bacterium]|nr:type II toxin-antitoxin system death-on-curing family toxin [Acidimicrobiia bacterium]